MVNRFSKRSLARLQTCDERLQALCHEVLQRMDITVLCGHRDKRTQNAAVARGASKVRWPNSRHNKLPALAVDIAPYPINWQDHGRFRALSELMKAQAQEMSLRITWGGDWTTLVDMPHYQIEAGVLYDNWRERLDMWLGHYDGYLAP